MLGALDTKVTLIMSKLNEVTADHEERLKKLERGWAYAVGWSAAISAMITLGVELWRASRGH